MNYRIDLLGENNEKLGNFVLRKVKKKVGIAEIPAIEFV